MRYELTDKKILVCGDNDVISSALENRLLKEPCRLLMARHEKIDIGRQVEIEGLLGRLKPDAVVYVSPDAGALHRRKSEPVTFLQQHLTMVLNLFDACHRRDVNRLIFLAPGDISPEPIQISRRGSAFSDAAVDPFRDWYYFVGRSGVRLCQSYRIQHGRDFVAATPTQLFAPSSTFSLGGSRILHNLMLMAREAKESGEKSVVVWGSGETMLEFLYSEDCADALVYLLKYYSQYECVKIGSGKEISISDLMRLVCDVVGYHGQIEFRASGAGNRPGDPVHSGRLTALGWNACMSLKQGIEQVHKSLSPNGESLSLRLCNEL